MLYGALIARFGQHNLAGRGHAESVPPFRAIVNNALRHADFIAVAEVGGAIHA